jgi:glycosyltransferase involved in cell wall biosynthesis
MSQLDLLVVVPAFNEERFIEGCLGSIASNLSVVDVTFHIVVVDNGSSDRTGETAGRLGVSVVRMDRASVSAARNAGVRAAPESKYVAFIDADVVITAEWVAAFVKLLRGDAPALLLTGCQYVVRDQASWIEKYWFKNLKDKHLNGGNIIVSRAAFDRISGFNESLKTGEDYDFCVRSQQSGVHYAVDEGFRAIHLGYPRELSGFVRREMWHGEGDFRSWKAFFRSPVAIIGAGYLLLTLVVLALLIGQQILLAALLASLLLLGNLALTFLRFPRCDLPTILANSVLNLIYFFARAMSFFRAMKNSRKKY